MNKIVDIENQIYQLVGSVRYSEIRELLGRYEQAIRDDTRDNMPVDIKKILHNEIINFANEIARFATEMKQTANELIKEDRT